MPMPSLFKYFALMGAALFGMLSLANFLLDPSTGATTVASTPKPVIAVQHDPRASKIERWRDDQAALKAAQQAPAGGSVSLAAKPTPVATSAARPTPEPYRSESAAVSAAVTEAAPQPAEPVAAAQTEPKPQPVIAAADTTAIVGVETAEEAAVARAAQAAERKAKVAKARAKRERLARERATSQPRTASNQQDQYYYGQHSGPQQQPFTTRYSSAYAPQQQSFGPFGWGRGW
jgi:hypothetical protein